MKIFTTLKTQFSDNMIIFESYLYDAIQGSTLTRKEV